ncbi:MAG: hypothetical protein HYR75_02630 [Gemmatimonadetes bacterium]|nr:hypothetical protein [Gemmatimonadota bacterium]
MLDSRTAAPIRLAALVGEAEGARAESVAARRWALVRDSLAATAPAGARSRLAAIAFDPRSFSIEVADRAPQAVFAIPSESRGESPSSAPTLSPQPMREGAWWSALRPQLPAGPDSLRRWSHDSTTLVAQIENESARLILRDATGREWKVGVIAAPVQRVVWLDATVDAATRKALQRAFSDASLYSESTRIAASPAPARGRAVRAALATRGPSPRHEHRRARVPRRQRMAS